MKIAIDRDIPYAQEAFSTLGQVTLLEQNEICDRSLIPFDALIVRSTCRVDARLLANSHIRFVGSTTIGHDHIDHNYLAEKKISFSCAPGCNAEAVGEFVINAILQFLKINNLKIDNHRLGIIGFGHTGSALFRKAKALGLQTCLCDPLLQKGDKKTDFLTLNEIIKRANILSFHVPLTLNGDYPTYHLLNDEITKSLSLDTILINTSRGEVFDQRAIIKHRSNFKGLILDVWENEPGISTEVLEKTNIATPHVAGYSKEGKAKATHIIYQQLCNYLQKKSRWAPLKYTGNQNQIIDLFDEKMDLAEILRLTYDIFQDDQELRALSHSDSPSDLFKNLRNNYSYRSEFRNFSLNHTKRIPKDLLGQLNSLGFTTVPRLD